MYAYEKVKEWFIDYATGRDEDWVELRNSLRDKSEKEISLEKLCFDAETFHVGWTKFDEIECVDTYFDDFYMNAKSNNLSFF